MGEGALSFLTWPPNSYGGMVLGNEVTDAILVEV